MTMLQTASNFVRRVAENRMITSGIVAATSLAVNQRICRDRDKVFSGLSVGGLAFVSRYRDWLGVREVIFDEEYRIVRSVLAGLDRPVVIDGGANIGMFALYVLAHFPRARLASYEPSGSTFAILEANRALNGGLDWHIHQAALWRAEENLTLRAMDWSTSSKVGIGFGTETVPGRDLQSVLNEAGAPVDLLKVDIEGAEQSFLCASPHLLQPVRHLLVELHPSECDTRAVIDVVRRRWKNLYVVSGRTSSKPLVLATDGVFDLSPFSG